MKRFLSSIALGAALAALAQTALAFGEEGHRMVGDIASRYLDPEASRQIAALLKYDRLADGQPSGRLTLGAIAYWADEIKDYPGDKQRNSWHYDDIPLCGTADRERYCRDGRCASAQLERHIAVLGDPKARGRQKNEALKWVVHLMGDIHQPLHAATRHDRGGNNVEVAFFGERENPPYGTIKLHTIWDIHMVRRLVADRGGENAVVSAPLAGADRDAWEQGSIADWVAESHGIAVTSVYAPLTAGKSCSHKIREVVEIGTSYYSMAAPILETQIHKAGVRLALVLNQALGQSPGR